MNPISCEVGARIDFSTVLSIGATTAAQCVCKPGYFDAAPGPNVSCTICPVGTACVIAGATLEGLPMLRGYFRLDSTTIDVRACPDARTNCSTTFGTTACVSTSGCRGGLGEPCDAGMHGTYCRLCDRSDGANLYYRPASADQVASCVECGDTLGVTIGLGAGGPAAVVAFLALGRTAWRWLPLTVVARIRNFDADATPKNKGKIVAAFYQVVTKVPSIYDVTLPADVSALLQRFSNVVTLGFEGVATTPIECMGLSGYVPRLLFWMIVPVVLVLLVVLGVRLSSVGKKRGVAVTSAATETGADREGSDESVEHSVALHVASDANEREASFFEKTLPFLLPLLFLLYPLVTKVAFDGFPCYRFDNGRGWLITDVSIECAPQAARTGRRRSHTGVAGP